MLLNLYILIFIKLNKLNVIFMEKNLHFSFIFSIMLKNFFNYRSATSERNFGTLVKVSCLFDLSEHCSARSKLVASKLL